MQLNKKAVLTIFSTLVLSACSSGGGSETPALRIDANSSSVQQATITPSNSTTEKSSTIVDSPNSSTENVSTVTEPSNQIIADKGGSWRKQPLGKAEYVVRDGFLNVLYAGQNTLRVPGQYPRNDNTLGYVYAVDENGNGRRRHGIISIFSNYSPSADSLIDYIALVDDNKPFLGEREAQIKGAAAEQYNGTFQNNLPVLKKDAYDVNVKFINQPYSTYAAIYTDALNDQLLTYVHYPKGERDVMDKYNNLHSGLQGTATYKGQVIGSVKNAAATHYSLPRVDGTVELTTDLGATSGKISGVINSDTLGRIELGESTVHYGRGDTNFQRGSAKSETMAGSYSGSLVGPELNEAVGKVAINNDAGAAYQAVFGAAK